VYCIAIDCDNDIDCAPPGTSFHHMPLMRNTELAKQVRFCDGIHVCVVTVATKPAII